MQATALDGGFGDAPIDAAHAFRAIMTAMARPGTIQSIAGAAPPPPLSAAAGCVLLTLCDPDTPISLAASHDTPEVRDWITFHTGAPILGAGADPKHAAFALGGWSALSVDAYPIGTPDYPDRSTTLIVEMDSLTTTGATLRGPGIKDAATLSLPETEAFQRNAAHFPLGCDFIFTHAGRVAALPRTTQVS